ncbi:prefoldin subunit alpha [Candidatus Pacearchaeota archaeon]|nr:prefoldin subunit alpha [Candidatus Pacearchaeota archaeon]
MDAELIYKAQALQKQIEEMQAHADLIEREMGELVRFKNDLELLEKSQKKEVLSSLGKGVFMKTERVEKELFVEVGAGIIVKKTPLETRAIIDAQLKKITEARLHALSKLELYHQAMQNLIRAIQEQQGTEGKNTTGS